MVPTDRLNRSVRLQAKGVGLPSITGQVDRRCTDRMQAIPFGDIALSIEVCSGGKRRSIRGNTNGVVCPAATMLLPQRVAEPAFCMAHHLNGHLGRNAWMFLAQRLGMRFFGSVPRVSNLAGSPGYPHLCLIM